MSNEHREHITDRAFGGLPPGSEMARQAIERVGHALSGRRWRRIEIIPLVFEPPPRCIDCNVIVSRQGGRCKSCGSRERTTARKHRSMRGNQ